MIPILSVIVLYNQKLYDCNTYKTLISSYDESCHIFIYDNSPISQHTQAEFSNSNIKYIGDTTNPGLSVAYNKAAEYASKIGIKWLLLLDQDTYFSPNIIHDYLDSMAKYPEIKLIVPKVLRSGNIPMSPILIRCFFNSISTNISGQFLDSKKYSAINSGMLINVDAMIEVGGYNEHVTLDFSDMQFVERFSTKFDKFYVMNSICEQEFSNDVQNIDQKLRRYEIFCTCLKNYDRKGWSSHITIALLVIKRALSLTIRNMDIRAVGIMYLKYFRG